MPVNTNHVEYDRWASEWRKCRDTVNGSTAVKAAGIEYLPKLGAHKHEDYEKYKLRATFHGATGRTVEGLSGAVFDKPPSIDKLPASVEAIMPTLGVGELPFQTVATQAVEEVLTLGRVGLHVDAAEGEEQPYVAVYRGEDIVNWRRAIINGKSTLSMVVLRETEERIDPKDIFKPEHVTVYRVLELVMVGDAPRLVVNIWELKAEGTEGVATGAKTWQKIRTLTPTMPGGRPVNFMPFIIITSKGVEECIQKPPILDLADTNLGHYRNSADLEHGLHFTALPTAWVAGFQTDQAQLSIGSEAAWVTENDKAKAGYLEFQGTGLKAITDEMTRKEARMAVLGARLLEEQKAQPEAAAAIRLRHAGERSVLVKIAQACSTGLAKALSFVATWLNDPAEVQYKLNEDYNTANLDAQQLTALFAAYQGGGISYDVWFWNLQRGEVLPPGTKLDDERDKIKTTGPALPPGTVAEDDDDVPPPTPQRPPTDDEDDDAAPGE